MSKKKNVKGCCNCSNCMLVIDANTKSRDTFCKADGGYIGYIEFFENDCKYWTKKKENRDGSSVVHEH